MPKTLKIIIAFITVSIITVSTIIATKSENSISLDKLLSYIPIYENEVEKSRDTTRRSNLLNLQRSLEQVYQDNGEYPDFENFKKYVSTYNSFVPIDPLFKNNPNNKDITGFGYYYRVGDSNEGENQIYILTALLESDEYLIDDGGIDDKKYEITSNPEKSKEILEKLSSKAKIIDEYNINMSNGTFDNEEVYKSLEKDGAFKDESLSDDELKDNYNSTTTDITKRTNLNNIEKILRISYAKNGKYPDIDTLKKELSKYPDIVSDNSYYYRVGDSDEGENKIYILTALLESDEYGKDDGGLNDYEYEITSNKENSKELLEKLKDSKISLTESNNNEIIENSEENNNTQEKIQEFIGNTQESINEHTENVNYDQGIRLYDDGN